MMTSFCSLVEPEREKESSKIVKVNVCVGSPSEDVCDEFLAPCHDARLPLGRAVAESSNGRTLSRANPHTQG